MTMPKKMSARWVAGVAALTLATLSLPLARDAVTR